jgi:hypothetical protein
MIVPRKGKPKQQHITYEAASAAAEHKLMSAATLA